ncbi:phosphatidylinositol N-acetylglucosaminyltransferase subunit H [Hyla sarda]|uniref:phosphatidylinositol N-acetylglucosaminyltransferase subunit H n=1 Tax=Hyla sarda TaxID=327740 RepID=UPI0024C419BA|nr:phosphatidylinositol N-acetylglucosaminyltransferase subunit H [Hyla sarda]
MEGKEFLDIYGNAITLQRNSYSDTCQDFTITSAKLSVRTLATWTCVVWLVAYGVFICTQHNAVLTAAILFSIVGLLLYLHLVKVDHESLLILGSLGIQRTSTYASGRENTVFIEMCRVQDVVINEGISMHRVNYYLCLLLKDPSGDDPQAGVSQVIPVFQSSQPRLDCLVEIYRSCQDILSSRRSKAAS